MCVPDDPDHGFVFHKARFGIAAGARSAKRLFIRAGLSLTFTGLGVALAVLFGAAGINQFAASPYINLLIAGIFLAFAFSLLGAYDIGVPSSVLTKLDGVTRKKDSHKNHLRCY